MVLVMLAGMALAQDAQPPINTQLYRPPVAAQRTLWTHDSQVGAHRQLTGQAVVHLAHDPLVYVRQDESTVELLRDVVQTDLIGGWTYRRVRFAVDVPVIIRATGDLGGETGLGDLTADVKVLLRDGSQDGPGVAVAARLPVPTSTVAGLSGRALAWDLDAIVDGEIGNTLLLANLGLRWAPRVRLRDLDWGPALHTRLGVGHQITDGVGVSVELGGQLALTDPRQLGAMPAEGLIGAWTRVSDHVVLRGGLGTALTRGIGAPSARGIVAVEWRPRREPVQGPAEPTAQGAAGS